MNEWMNERMLLTVITGAPLTVTASANRTRFGLFFNFAFLAAVSKEDFFWDCNVKLFIVLIIIVYKSNIYISGELMCYPGCMLYMYHNGTNQLLNSTFIWALLVTSLGPQGLLHILLGILA